MASSIKQAPLSCPGHTRPVVDIHFSDKTDCGSVFISASKDGKAILRYGDTGDWIGTFLGHQGAIWSCVLDSHATKAATGAADFTAKIWDAVSGQELLSLVQEHIVRCVDLSRNDSGAHLLTANNAKMVTVYDLAVPNEPVVRFQAHDQIIRKALWCHNDRLVLTASEDCTIRLWDLADRSTKPVASQMLWTNTPSEGNACTDINLSGTATSSVGVNGDDAPPTSAVVVCGTKVSLHSFDWRNISACPQPLTDFTLPCPIYSANLQPGDGDYVVCGGEDHCIYRLDRKTGDILETCRGHFGPVHCVRFSPNGHLYASGSEDGTVRLWQTQVGQSYGLWQLAKPTSCESAPIVTSPANGVPMLTTAPSSA